MRQEMMEQGLLDFAPDDTLAGFRLDALEVYNWGTFHKKVWRLTLNSRNGLLTGDIGSGKSTLVDAVTTLLVPAQRIAYNKAAGADTRERSLRSYVQGYYKSERSDMGHAAKSVALRDQNSFSVILGQFKNRGFVQDVTLAQVFWTKEARGQPERFYVVGDRVLSIARDFNNFGPDIGQLKKRLKKMKDVAVFDTFPKYGAAFRRRFGIENEQALALFHQTVSMKSVGNLTDFVREHMLEAFDVAPRIEALIHHFDDLRRAHDAVLKAKHQIERLTPLVAECRTHGDLGDETRVLRNCRDALTPYFAFHKKALYKKRMKNLEEEQGRLDRKITILDTRRREQMGERDGLKQAISENGGDRLERIRSVVWKDGASNLEVGEPTADPLSMAEMERTLGRMVSELKLRAASGDGQQMTWGAALTEPLVVEAIWRSEDGERPVEGVPVRFGFERGSGALDSVGVTDARGRAACTVHRVSGEMETARVVARVDTTVLGTEFTHPNTGRWLAQLAEVRTVFTLQRKLRRLFVAVDETVLGEATGEKMVENLLKERISEWGKVAIAEDRTSAEWILEGGAAVRAGQHTAGIFSCYATVTVRLFEVQSRIELFKKRLDGVKGFHIDQREAGRRALKKAGSQIAEEVVSVLEGL